MNEFCSTLEMDGVPFLMVDVIAIRSSTLEMDGVCLLVVVDTFGLDQALESECDPANGLQRVLSAPSRQADS